MVPLSLLPVLPGLPNPGELLALRGLSMRLLPASLPCISYLLRSLTTAALQAPNTAVRRIRPAQFLSSSEVAAAHATLPAAHAPAPPAALPADSPWAPLWPIDSQPAASQPAVFQTPAPGPAAAQPGGLQPAASGSAGSSGSDAEGGSAVESDSQMAGSDDEEGTESSSDSGGDDDAPDTGAATGHVGDIVPEAGSGAVAADDGAGASGVVMEVPDHADEFFCMKVKGELLHIEYALLTAWYCLVPLQLCHA